jgi:hypothetical protein
VSDPSVVTRAQALAKAQVIQQAAAAFPGVINPQEAVKRVFEAAQIDDIEALIAQPQGPPPNVLADIDKTKSETALNTAKIEETKAKAAKDLADARATTGEAQAEGATHAAFVLGATHEGGVSNLEGAPSVSMGVQGNGDGLGAAIQGVAGGELGEEQPGPAVPEGMPNAG